MLNNARSQIAKATDLAVTFVLDLAGIKVEPDAGFFEDQIDCEMIVVGGSGQVLGRVEMIVDGYLKLAPTLERSRMPRLISLDQIDYVDTCVYLKKDQGDSSEEVDTFAERVDLEEHSPYSKLLAD